MLLLFVAFQCSRRCRLLHERKSHPYPIQKRVRVEMCLSLGNLETRRSGCQPVLTESLLFEYHFYFFADFDTESLWGAAFSGPPLTVILANSRSGKGALRAWSKNNTAHTTRSEASPPHPLILVIIKRHNPKAPFPTPVLDSVKEKIKLPTRPISTIPTFRCQQHA